MTNDTLAVAVSFEFKILRVAGNGFRLAAFLQQCLDEQARFGWSLVEKLDDSRIRLSRPVAARKGDVRQTGDPYRSWARMNPPGIYLVMGAILLVAMIVVFFGWLVR